MTTSSVYHLPGFAAFLAARLLAVFAMQIQAVVVAWQVYDITRDPLSLAYVGLAQFVPMLFLLLPAGDLIDRYDRKLILALSWLFEPRVPRRCSGCRCEARRWATTMACWCYMDARGPSPGRRCPACCRRSYRASALPRPSPPTA
ncbi:hypothetical protein SSTU70S_01203 [Stutzerimonas stutzeri]